MKNAQRFPHLLNAKLLSGLPQDLKAEFLNACTARVIMDPEQILTQGEPSPGLYLIAHGRLEIAVTDAQGDQTIVAQVGPGETVGELETIGDRPCIASCSVEPVATLLFCPRTILSDFLRQPNFVRNIAGAFLDRMDRDNRFRALDMHGSIDQKLGQRLLQLANGSGRVKTSQARLADILGCSRQSVNRALGRLRDKGIIETSKGAVVVLDQVLLAKETERETF